MSRDRVDKVEKETNGIAFSSTSDHRSFFMISKNRTCPFAVGGHMLMFISPPKLFCGLGRFQGYSCPCYDAKLTKSSKNAVKQVTILLLRAI
ncbi:hypothetical protein NC651_000295 [Populus alba x Populus x berolinensis]|nr:hypothetical protein NC651_000295 [Populus alba x Populus x berolinensis]